MMPEEEVVKTGDEEESAGYKDLVDEGAKPDEVETKPDAPKGDDESESEDESTSDETEGLGAIQSQLDALSSKLDEKDAEITFLRGEVARRDRGGEKAKAEDDEFNLDEIVADLTNKDPKVAARKIIELSNKIADKKVAAIRAETTNLLTSNQAVIQAKQTDRDNVAAEFAGYLDDPRFEAVLTTTFKGLNRGGRYIPDSLYAAASTAARIIDRERAAKNGKSKNGVKEVRPGAPKNPIEPDTHDYSKAVRIDDLKMTDREKLAAKGALKKMTGVTEKQWVENWKEING